MIVSISAGVLAGQAVRDHTRLHASVRSCLSLMGAAQNSVVVLTAGTLGLIANDPPIGDRHSNMFNIFAYLGKSTLGDFLTDAMFACAVRELYDDAALYIYYVDNRPYKADIVRCIWNAQTILRMPPSSDYLPIELFDSQSRTAVVNIPSVAESGALDADLILVGNVFQEAALPSLPLPTLRIPEKKFASSDQALIDLGLDPSRWIATVYWKEPGYEFRRFNPVREIVDPAPYIAVIRHIVEELGGQVVRIGHPTDIVIPELPGFIDLAKVENSHWLQMYAVSVSRFMLASASGPSAFGPAFGVPTVLTDHLEVTGVWRPHDYIVTRTFFDSDKSYRQEAAADAGFLDGYVRWFKDPVPGAGYHFNTAAELIDAANEMYQSTAACIGWRGPMEGSVRSPRPNAFVSPTPKKDRRDLLIPPSRRKST